MGDAFCCFETGANGGEIKDMYTVRLRSWIIDRGLADPFQDPTRRLRIAILWCDTEMAEEALRDGALPSAGAKQHPWPPLLLAAAHGRESIIAAMGEISPYLIDVDAKGRDGNRALHLTAIGQHKAACLELLHLGASVGAVNDAGQTPVDVASVVAWNPATDLLIAARAKEAALEAIREIEGPGLSREP